MGNMSAEEGCISLGPWGWNAGTDWAYKVEGPILQITIQYGVQINSISFESRSSNGVVIGSSVKIGGTGGRASAKFCIDSSVELLSSVSLTHKPYTGYGVVSSLCFNTDQKTYGPFGSEKGDSVSIPIKSGVIAGFHGRGGRFLQAFGIFVAPNVKGKVSDEEGMISLGPWGGKDGEDWVYKNNGPIMDISIRYGEAISSILFQSTSIDGRLLGSSKKIGGTGGHTTETFTIDSSIEQLSSIGLKYGDCFGRVVITSLCFDTNRKTYGPFGTTTDGFSLCIPVQGGVTVGFHGRAETYLTAIGIFLAPKVNNFPSSDKRFDCLQSDVQGPCDAPTQIEDEGWMSLGPWGGNGGGEWAYKVDGPVLQITVVHGVVIDSILFESKDRNGVISKNSLKVGGTGGSTASKFCIDSSVEQLSSLSVTYGDFFIYQLVTSLTFNTNLNKYGPYGSGGGDSMLIPVEGGVIAGFHGRGGIYLDAIGIFVAPKAEEHGLLSLGPWGGEDGVDWFYKSYGPIMQIIICYGEAIDSMLFRSLSFDGHQIGSSKKIGGTGGNTTKTFCIDSSLEKLLSISLTYGEYCGQVAITSLCFYTNLKTYGPFGTVSDASSLFIPVEDGVLIGFHGRGGTYVTSIGIFVASRVNNLASWHSVQDPNVEPAQLKGKVSGDEGWISLGPWGGNDGNDWFYKADGPIIQITIHSGVVVDSILFESISQDGIVRDTSARIGGTGGGGTKFCINSLVEQISSVSLTYNDFGGRVVLTSLCFNTKLKKHGPFGMGGGHSVLIPIEGGLIAGFHGRRGNHYLNAIGIFVAPKVNEVKNISDGEGWISLGPWGGKDGVDWAYKFKGPLMQIIICYGEAIDSILFRSRSSDGFILESSKNFGGTGGHTTKMFCIDSSVEEFSSLKLTYKDYNGQVALRSLCFETNIGNIYGPFGAGSSTPSVSIPIKGGVLVGFHGRAGTYLTGIGVFLAPKVNDLHSTEKKYDEMHSDQDSNSAPNHLKGMISSEGPISLGPWGGSDGVDWDFKVNGPILNISIGHGKVINSIFCKIMKYDGNVTGNSGKIGCAHADVTNTFCIDTSEEQLTSISLTHDYENITSLCFNTNLNKFGPFGLRLGRYSDCIPIKGRFSGLYGRTDGTSITAIGVFVAPEVNSPHSIQDPNYAPSKLEVRSSSEEGLISLGPWGGDEGVDSLDWEYKVNGPLMHISIGYGKAINSISFKSKLYDSNAMRSFGKIASTKTNSHVIETFCIDTSEEQLTSINLTHDHKKITSLCFNTNLNKFGPFGSGSGGFPESIPIEGEFIGFHGRADGRCITAIGIFVIPKVNSPHSIQDPNYAPAKLEVSGVGSKSKRLEAPTIKSNSKLRTPGNIIINSAAPSSSSTKKDDHHGQAPNPSSDTIGTNLDLIDSAFHKYQFHMDMQINDAREKLKELQRLGSREGDFDELEKAITNLKLQIPSIKSQLSLRSLVAKSKPNFCGSKPKMLENNVIIHIADPSSATTKKGDHHDGAPPQSFEKIRMNLDIVYSAFHMYRVHMEMQISEAREKLKELQQLGSRKSNFDKLRKAIAKLNFQIPLVTEEDDHHSGALSPTSRIIHGDLTFLDTALGEAEESVRHMKGKINQAHEKFKELQILQPSDRASDIVKETDSDKKELRKALAKLKVQIHSVKKTRSADSNTHHQNWDNINRAEEGMTHFFHKEEEPEILDTGDFNARLKVFLELPEPLQNCLLCFFKFPPQATIKRTPMIYLWIGQGYVFRYLLGSDEGYIWDVEVQAGKIFDELIAKGFIEPIYKNWSLVPASCKMSRFVRSCLYEEAKRRGFTSNGILDLDPPSSGCVDLIRQPSCTCLVNVGEAIINFQREIFENMKHIRSLYLGRWQSSATDHIELDLERWQRSTTHHIELANAKILHGLNKLSGLTFLSLRGISTIMELPTFISKLPNLMILDLRACYNLEVIPDKIGLLKRLTHLDLSECYYLENMPKSLGQLSNLQVLKGFLIGDFCTNKNSCTLRDLLGLQKLRKLNIHVSVKDLRLQGLEYLKKFEGLSKLTISWARSQARVEDIAEAFHSATLPPRLQKLDLQCFPLKSLNNWLMPSKVKELKKLYIRGGQLRDLGVIHTKHSQEQLSVEILRLGYLSELELHWRELETMFPKLIYLHQVNCPNFFNFQGDKTGVWINKMAIDTHIQLRNYHRTRRMINSSSMLGSTSA